MIEQGQISNLADEANATRDAALQATAARRGELPLRYLRQQVHLTAPASDSALALKAISDACGAARRGLARYEITAEDLADRFDMDVTAVRDEVERTGTAPLVMLDLEDGVPPDLVADARREAVSLFRDGEWADCLRFYRPSALASERCVDDLIAVLTGAGEGLEPSDYPIDGVIFPKLQHAHEVEWLDDRLADVESALGLEPNRIRVIYLIETGWGLANLEELAIAGIDRLAGIALGTVDLSADVGVPHVHFRHPLCEWARSVIVTIAGGAKVPAIDGMTLDFPVGRRELSLRENHDLVLDRIEQCFGDASHSIELGMAGRWVGHPLQLLATMLAFRAAFPAGEIEAELDKLERFSVAMTDGKGAVAGGNSELLDVGTDTHTRAMLRRAAAWRLVDPHRLTSYGIVTADEVAAS
ncbi:MAG TPA: aldolase/citrate lyase family protein [Solirubrobacteraceae bacterium]|jgi:citrate lyase beta subunit